MFPRSVIQQMADEADAAINAALLRGASPMLTRPRKEVAYVAAVTLGGLYGIADAWGPICRGWGFGLNLAGVFCHAAPEVRFKGKAGAAQCELADLLVVTDLRKKGRLVRTAALIQAKMACAKFRVYLTGASSGKQLDLYQNWHQFDFVDQAYDMKRVNLHVGPDPFFSGSFGVIDPRFDGQPRWTQHCARPTPRVFYDFSPRLGRFIAEMVDRTPGFGRLATPSLNTDWSKTVEMLLKVTYKRTFGEKAILGPLRPPRGASAVVCYSSKATPIGRSAFLRSVDKPPPYIIPDEAQREPNGLSIVHLEVVAGED
jgi:hypothetical protein